MKYNKKNILIGIILLLVVLIVIIIINNKNVTISYIEYKSDNIPYNFDGFSIVQISDLHNEEFGDNQQDLINEIESINPDVIIITGDLIDNKKYNIDVAMKLIKGIGNIAPLYYVSGNHEAWSNYTLVKEALINEDVIVLENEMSILEIDGEIIEIHGIEDPSFNTGDNSDVIKENLEYYEKNDNFKILLSHRPELFDIYVEYEFDLVFSGHAHGGQIRLPFIGGIIAPDQGLFPEYDAGLYEKDNTTMYVSRGLGNSIIPLRINNNPELVNLVLKKN